ncbi:HIT family protein [Haloferax mediterranei ATCC 33500]|uniref:HIT family hydrolase n=1 Tax=Haloferax mediterranei (strain ATCC 33500 / DSM 1411 / JCM 8866 / NBRC 14739 / NCIMB 2177 / R-4) TaxID=523841 RepID=I3R165_HALMT|nr:HIT family protein [Haloferax mediterranei]AFK17975.1 histidine triad (HIT) hydrolase [Haloferax mediterranei ATCC 33500]AHZ22604.1 HIT family hydrolase [Haloferax mediterranei ATCC 33500]EMA02748.1 histidine triad (HIT) hydrolase [Haloferax mediterranei ATCC 33500]MDX5988067.1 HIT family protein [Haloferax mediterranei ATCC 33500]QCQ74526.1 HIT family protein [Haloferax mediterranei ATCC 33500]
MSDCIFCAIAARDIHGRIVHETEHSLAFLDVNPLAPGHTLVVPKDHYARLDDLPDEISEDLFRTVDELVPRVEEAVDADATNIGLNNGPAAGQEVEHVHAHIIPRFEDDGGNPIHAVAGKRPDLSDEEMDDIESDISDL